MFNLLDILQAQGGPGLQGVGQPYGLSPEQTRKAMEALLPAFGLGLQRTALVDPMGLGQLLGLVGINGAGRAPPPSQPDLLVQRIFGSPQLSQAVIQQAAAASGVATPILRQMLPVAAGMVVAGIVHLMLNQPAQSQAPSPAGSAPSHGFSPASYWAEMMRNWSAGQAQPAGRASPERPVPRWADAAQALTPPSSRNKPAPQPPTPDAAAPHDPFQQLFQAGIDAQQENVAAMQSLFDAFWRKPEPASTAVGATVKTPPGGQKRGPP